MSISLGDAKPRQAGRTVRLETPLGPDVLALTRFDGREAMDELFEFRVEAISQSDNLDFDKALGKNCGVTVATYGEERHFNGVLVDAQWRGQEGPFFVYSLVLRPWFWLLGRKADCRIFKDKSIFDIIDEVLKDGGFPDYEIKASRGDYPKIEYVVQYRETDLAFIRRLIEEWGAYTFVEHERERHKLVFADALSCHKPVRGATRPFVPLEAKDRRPSEHIYHWTSERRFRTGKMATDDFDYMKPRTDLSGDAQASERYARSTLEAYDYPGRHTERDIGKRRATVRLQAEQSLDRRRHASGDAASLHPGCLFTLQKHGTDDGQYLVVAATHRIVDEQAYRTGGGAGGGDVSEIYRGEYELQKADRPYRAPLVTPKPLVHGPQTAFVVTRPDKKGEEIDVDEEGRIFVQFHWNRKTERISRAVRVAQMWSGKIVMTPALMTLQSPLIKIN